VLLAYLKQYPSELVDGWSSGTGMAGVTGSLLYIGMGTWVSDRTHANASPPSSEILTSLSCDWIR